METLKISRNVYLQIIDTIGKRPPECGGVLGAHENGNTTEFFFDEHGLSTPNGYTPDVQSINEMLVNDWMPRNILMVGIVHSHSNGIAVPSCGDVAYGIRILNALDTVDRFYLPIVTTNEKGFHITGYVIRHNAEGNPECRAVPVQICE